MLFLSYMQVGGHFPDENETNRQSDFHQEGIRNYLVEREQRL
jgi:hypothetical protein